MSRNSSNGSSYGDPRSTITKIRLPQTSVSFLQQQVLCSGGGLPELQITLAPSPSDTQQYLANCETVIMLRRAIRARHDIYMPKKSSMLAGLPDAIARQTHSPAEVLDKLDSLIREFETVEELSR